jgi:hypothetical protein
MPVNNQIPIPTKDVPSGWKAEEIVYSKIGFKSPGTRLEFFLDPSSYTIPGDDLSYVLTQLLNNHPVLNGTGDKHWGGPGKPHKRTPLDILIDKKCWVIIELDKQKGWKFPKDGPGLTTKEDYDDSNVNLRYYNDHGVISPDPLSDCRILFFAVAYRETAGEIQCFNFNLALEEEVKDGQPPVARVVTMEIMIDPDIPNGNGQF